MKCPKKPTFLGKLLHFVVIAGVGLMGLGMAFPIPDFSVLPPNISFQIPSENFQVQKPLNRESMLDQAWRTHRLISISS